MSMEERTIEEVDQYIANLPEDMQVMTESLRKIILNSSSELKEEYGPCLTIRIKDWFVICKRVKNM